jgi:hypothetical protein
MTPKVEAKQRPQSGAVGFFSVALRRAVVPQFARQWSLPSRMGKPPDRFSADDSYE